MILCVCLLLMGFLTVGIKLVKLQVVDHDDWVKYVDEQRKTSILIPPRRGTIYCRKMTTQGRTTSLLATSIVEEVLCVAPAKVENLPELAKALAPYAGMSADRIIAKVRDTKLHLVYLRRGLDPETADKVKAMNLKGVEFRSESSRRYPKGFLASNVVGFANIEGIGMEGVELRYDTELAGEAGKKIVIKDNSRRQIPFLTQTVREARDGNHVVLTIDEGIQYITEKALDGVMESFSPESASAVVLNPKTGEVLGMACRPTFDPSRPATYKSERLRNRVIADSFEPGSTFKPIAAAAALERKVISPEDRVYCELGAMRYHGHTFNDVHPLGEISFADVIAQSSNIGMIKVVSLMQPQSLYDCIRGFGFAQLTSIDLPGEAAGLLRPPSKWSGLSMGALPIGQELSVTTLQLAAAYSAIANNGQLMQPYVVSEVLSPDGDVIKKNQPQPVRQVIRPDVARSLSNMMARVVTEGTGTAARIKGYTCAGKTGTAQKANLQTGGYYRDKYVAVFAGFLPVDDPVACIAVVVDSPKGEYYGGQVSAPAFKEIAEGIIYALELPPTMPEEQASPQLTPRIVRKPKGPARRDPQLEESDGLPRMPDVRGMTMKAVLESLAVYSLEFEFEGSGVAFSQDPAPGAKIVTGRRVQIAFRQKDAS